MARAIGDFMNTAGGEIYVPYAFLADGNIITVYDPSLHQPSTTTATEPAIEDNEATVRRLLNTGTVDQRWVRIRRPVIVTGGELNLDMLDLRYNAEANFYQAPLHFKANGGVFLIDDFGRQLCSPKELLNRWILPLEDRHDFLTRGQRQEVPGAVRAAHHLLDQPRPEGPGGRRLPAAHPAQGRDPRPDAGRVREDLQRQCCKRLGMNPCPEAVDYLYERYYNRGRTPAGQRLPRFAGNRPVDLPIQTAARAFDARPDRRGGGQLHRRVHVIARTPCSPT